MNRGFAMLLVLMVLFVLGALATSALALLRPVQRNLDERASLQQAQATADCALQSALANAARGDTAGFVKEFPVGEKKTGRAVVTVSVIDSDSLKLDIAAAVPDATQSLGVVLEATIRKLQSGHWSVRDYRLSPAR